MDHYNLLFIFTDEQRADTLAAYGNPRIQMPHLNRLAAQSTVFDQAYVTQPVCTPSRATIMTGLYPHTCGCTENNIPLRPETPCLPEMLSRGDYATAYHGKWHLGDEIFAQHGFDEWISIEDGYNNGYGEDRDQSTRSSYHHFLLDQGLAPQENGKFGRGQAARFPEEFGKPAFLAGEAGRFIRQNQDRPFVLYVNFLEPHMPFFGPRDDQHDPAQVTLPPNFDHLPTRNQPLKTRAFQQAYRERGHSGLPLETESDWRRLIANYWGLCSLVDTHTGAILDTLDECGLGDRTIVVYTSDHGDMMGSHRLLAKCVNFEEAMRVPLLIRLPGQTRGQRVTGPVSQVDLVPTLLELMGQPIPDHLQGQSLGPALEQGTCDRDVFIEWNGANSGIVGESAGNFWIPEALKDTVPPAELGASLIDPVRTVISPEGWKFNCSPLGEHELYDLNNDPLEIENRMRDPACRPRLDDLLARLRNWQEETQDQVDLPGIS